MLRKYNEPGEDVKLAAQNYLSPFKPAVHLRSRWRTHTHQHSPACGEVNVWESRTHALIQLDQLVRRRSVNSGSPRGSTQPGAAVICAPIGSTFSETEMSDVNRLV